MSVAGGVVLHPVPTRPNGELAIDQLALAIRDESDPECAIAGAVTIENPHVQRGGVPLGLDYMARLGGFTKKHGLRLHIDGARIFNAAVATGIPVNELVLEGDTVQFCLSKSLGCPVGSVLTGAADHIRRARRWRKLLGGGMRQTGMLAAAGLYALDHHVSRLADDHELARRLATGLATVEELDVNTDCVPTNMVIFSLRSPDAIQSKFLHDIRDYGVRFGEVGQGKLRAVTHLQHGPGCIDEAVVRVKKYFASCRSGTSPVSR